MTTVPRSVHLRGRGQLTIPKELREALSMEENASLNLFVVGQCLILTSKKLLRSSLSGKVAKNMKEEGLTLQGLLDDLKQERARTIHEKYGQ